MNDPANDIAQQSEREFCASLLRDPKQLADVATITPEHLGHEPYRLIVGAMVRLRESGQAITAATVAEELKRRGELDRVYVNGQNAFQALAGMLDGFAVGVAGVYVPAIVERFNQRQRRELLGELIREVDSSTCGNEELAAKFEAVTKALRTQGQSPTTAENPLIAKAMTSAELDEIEVEHEPLIEDLAVANEPLLICGASKTLKTGIGAIEMAVAVASGGDVFGKYRVPKARIVFVISAESGVASLKARMRQVCKAKGLDPKALSIIWYTEVEQLATLNGQRNLEAALRHFGATVCILDPAYLLIGGDVTADSAGNMFAMGGLLNAVNLACKSAGATCCILTHANGRINVGEPMELSHIAWSGFQQWARQWWLISRREKYADDGRHSLFLRYGGSAGHTGLIHLDIDEGTKERGRRWEVSVLDAGEVRKAATQEKEAKALERINADCTVVLSAMTDIIGDKATVATVNALVTGTGLSRTRVEAAITKLLGDEAIVKGPGTIKNGPATKTVEGIRRPDSWGA